MAVINIQDFGLPAPTDLLAMRQEGMISNAFEQLHRWMGDIVPKLEGAWKVGIDHNTNRRNTETELVLVAGKIDFMGVMLIHDVNVGLKVSPAVKEVHFKLPADATEKGGQNGPLPADKMVAALFQQIPTWFKNVLSAIRPAYNALLKKVGADANDTASSLYSLRDFVNAKKKALIDAMNKELIKRGSLNRFQGFSSANEDDVHDTLREEILGVEIGDNIPLEFDQDVEVDLDDRWHYVH